MENLEKLIYDLYKKNAGYPAVLPAGQFLSSGLFWRNHNV